MNNDDIATPSLNELQETFLLDNLDKNELDLLLKHSQRIFFQLGETILAQGKQIDGIYLILKGDVSVTAKIMGLGTTYVGLLHPGHFLSIIGFMEKSPCTNSFIANNEALCLFIPKHYFEMLSIYHPETQYKIFHIIAIQLCQQLKFVHDRAISLISELDMASLSLFGRAIYSLQQPQKTSFEDTGINKKSLLNKPFFRLFSTEEQDELLHHITLMEAPKNCKIVKEQDKNAVCYLIIYGGIQSNLIQNNKLAKLSVIGPDILLATPSCIDNHPALNITFITCEETILYKISDQALQFFKINKPSIWYKLFNLICYSLANLNKSIDKLDVRLRIETYNR